MQVSFPVTDRTNFRLSYSHQVQAPDFGLLLGGINIDLGNTNTNQVFGSDLDFGKTIAFEFGIRHAFNDDMVLDIAAYNKDIVSDPAARLVSLFDPAQGRDNDFRMLTNLDFGNVRGIDIRLDRRFGNYFNGTVGYAFQQAKNTGSDPFTYVNYGSRIVNQVGGNNGAQPPPQGILPTDDSRPHAFTGAFSVTLPGDYQQGTVAGTIFRNVSMFMTFRYTSGTAYTKCGESNEEQSVLSIENCVRLFPEGLNTQRLPSFKEINTRFTKGFGLGGLDLTAYLDVRNLLNFRNVIQVFAVNGDTHNDEEREANLEADLADLASERDANGAAGAGGALVLPTAHEDCADLGEQQEPSGRGQLHVSGPRGAAVRRRRRCVLDRRTGQRHQRAVRRRPRRTAPARCGTARTAGLRTQLLMLLPCSAASARSERAGAAGRRGRVSLQGGRDAFLALSACSDGSGPGGVGALRHRLRGRGEAEAWTGVPPLRQCGEHLHGEPGAMPRLLDRPDLRHGVFDGGRRHLAPRHRGPVCLRFRYQHRGHHRGG